MLNKSKNSISILPSSHLFSKQKPPRIPPAKSLHILNSEQVATGVCIVPSSHLFPKQMMWHARSVWWFETKSYARILRASSAPCGRGSKDQKFSLPFFFSSAGGVGGADKKWKGNFWFCFAVSDYEKSNLILTFLFALFSVLTATEALPLRVCW